jgi:FeoB-associated Cys-rich membrane protein
MNVQKIIALLILGIAIRFLIVKFFWKNKSKGNCGDDCGCH